MIDIKQHTRRVSGKPRNTYKILNATIEALESNGYSSLAIEVIAVHAGVGKTTIYRWWDNKEYLVMDAFLMTITSQINFNQNKSIYHNLQQHLYNLAKIFNSKIGRSILAIISENEELANIFCSFF
ncbi:TetR/AcrR family transcriptional regulator [Priestia megaterium]